MRCSKCGGDSKVIDSRHDRSNHNRAASCEEGFIYRRRECVKCSHRWNTIEMNTDRMDDYDIELERDTLKQKLKAFRKTVLELERMTR